MGKKGDLTGRRFGRLTVISEDDARWSGSVVWLCKCDCGNYKRVRASHLKRGAVISCGCYNKQKDFVHGESNTRLHHIWACMLDRCTNPNSAEADRYIDRGIKVCDEWLNSYEAFAEWSKANGYIEDAKRGDCTLDRIDNDGDYSPSNCRWVDMKVQGRNRRNNHLLTLDGKTHCIAEWGEIMGIDPSRISKRLERGWNIRDAICRPIA